MADEAVLAEATQNLSFAEFLNRMKDPAASDLVRHIKQFIKTFDDRKPDPDRDSELVQDFMLQSEGLFRQHPVWASAPPGHQAQALEGLEKYLMTKIYHKTFGVSELDLERDEALLARMNALCFVKPVHLDIPPAYQDERAWLLAMKELHKINNYKAPRDKIVCILNCCRVINNLLHVAAQAGEARGADDFLPVLIYVVIHAKPPRLASNLEYIQRFRMASRMVSESSYFYTQLYSAASFIETINTASLSMDPQEFIGHMAAGGIPDMQIPMRPSSPAAPSPASPLHASQAADMQREKEAQMTGALLASSAPSQTPAADKLAPTIPGVRELELEGIGLVVEAEAQGVLQSSHPYLYAVPGSLRIGDVAVVLQQYKEIVLRYEALSRAIEHRHATGRAADPALQRSASQRGDTPRAYQGSAPPLRQVSSSSSSALPGALGSTHSPMLVPGAVGGSPRDFSGAHPAMGTANPSPGRPGSAAWDASSGSKSGTPRASSAGGPTLAREGSAPGAATPTRQGPLGVPMQGPAMSPLDLHHQGPARGLASSDGRSPRGPPVAGPVAHSVEVLEDDEPDVVEAESGMGQGGAAGTDGSPEDSLFAALLCRQGELEDPTYSAGAGSVPFPPLSGAMAEHGGQVSRGHSGSGRDAFGTGQAPLGRGGSGGRYGASSGGTGALSSAVEQVPLAYSTVPGGPSSSANGDLSSFSNMLPLTHKPIMGGSADEGIPSHAVLASSTNMGRQVFDSLASDPYMKYLNEVRDKPFSPTNSQEELAGPSAVPVPQEGAGTSTLPVDVTASLFNGLEVAVKPNQAENLGGSFTGSLI